MKPVVAWITILVVAYTVGAQTPSRPILIGVEYAYPGGGAAFSKLGIPAVKLYPDSITWGDMQRAQGVAFDFSKMDRFVSEYQSAGFQDLVLVLKSNCRWASKSLLTNPTPKAEFLGDYEAWVKACVERYDADGRGDMPGLKRPVRYFEVGSEFSSFEPEPPAEYVVVLDRAAKAARSASNQVQVLHAAFMAPTIFKDHPRPDQYAAAFAAFDAKKIKNHGLAGMRLVLDHHAAFDAVNFHALADPIEIEDTVAWLKWEMRQRKVQKPIIISDTTPNPLIAWGPATRATPPMGIVTPPATERDRPALNAYFTKLIDEEPATVAWTHAFVAADMVKKVVIAAEQGVVLINTSFMEDLNLFKKLAQAGAGTSAWAGMADAQLNILTQQRTIKGLRPSFYAVQQLQRQIGGYKSVERVNTRDPRLRVYKFTRPGGPIWVAWFEPATIYLPTDSVPQRTYALPVKGRMVIEAMIDQQGQTKPQSRTESEKNGVLELRLTPRPVYVTPAG